MTLDVYSRRREELLSPETDEATRRVIAGQILGVLEISSLIAGLLHTEEGA
ncbi:hypothetical protein [Amycolatopsis thailandensis]|uniref:hypothetical protein n=1 Tax=Amycolatopsis thailandensis TaxID=589330 RepID=UPI00142D9862|nr:hypothetical protein [Amycolatopsis thailandensis]